MGVGTVLPRQHRKTPRTLESRTVGDRRPAGTDRAVSLSNQDHGSKPFAKTRSPATVIVAVVSFDVGPSTAW